MREESISESLRKLAGRHANVIGETTEEARRNMGSAYSVRSKLLHVGYASGDEIAAAAAWLRKGVPAILETLAYEASKLEP